jgi:glycolate oxidase
MPHELVKKTMMKRYIDRIMQDNCLLRGKVSEKVFVMENRSYGKVNADLISALESIAPGAVITESDQRLRYGSDETEDLSYPPEVVVKPATTAEVAAIMKLCNEARIPVTPIGARTGLSGGALSVYGGVGLSMEKFNRIIHIDEKNHQVITEPAVITQVLQEAVAERGLFYPPDPSSRGSCFIGGNLAENSGGPKAVKYGVTREYVLDLEVVLPSGEVIHTGAPVLKNSTGYSLTQLMVGSEGTLGVITRATLKLIPLPLTNVLMLVPFFNAEEACEAVAAIFRAGITPSAMEFMERDAIDWVCRFDPDIAVEVPAEIQAHLLIELDGNLVELLQQEAGQLAEVLGNFNTGEILYAEDEAQKLMLWRMRRRVAEAVKANSVYKEEDTVVPRYELPKLLRGIKEIGKRYGFQSVCWNATIKIAIRELFVLVHELGGTLSGEHGIGLVQREYMDIKFPPHHLELFRGIKAVFDPNGIMNPGKIF